MSESETRKKHRKANFSDVEKSCLLEGIAAEKEVIQSKLQTVITMQSKTEAWAGILCNVNACSKETMRNEAEIKKKWKDLKSAVVGEQHDQRKTGGDCPPKATLFKDVVLYIIGETSGMKSGIEGGYSLIRLFIFFNIK
jgi:hypothetical protein